jgi:N-methylhydantoinase B/oxoprolinase/acetone carboxylase alpha subunit
MARETITDLKAQIESRDREVARLQGIIAELREDRSATAVALRLMRALIDDAERP